MTISEIIELETTEFDSNVFVSSCENCSDNDPDPNDECYDAPTESPLS